MADTSNEPDTPKREVEGWRPADPSTLPQPGDINPLSSDAYIDSAMRRARTDVNIWVARERQLYADQKWNAETHNPILFALQNNPHQSGETNRQYYDWILDYMKRAQQFGLDSLQGRQALGKALVTMHHMLESVVVSFGPLPEPGVPSGENCG